MIKPKSFCSNPDTIDSNSFQTNVHLTDTSQNISLQAQLEFEQFQKKLIENKINILLFEESSTHFTPDALFPNNWFCHLPDGHVFIFPMYPKNRRLEYRADIIQSLDAKKITDLRYLENENIFLEGTGSLILDHKNKIGFACLSNRTSAKAINIFSQLSGYNVISFDSVDENNFPVYHTNVMMTLSPLNAVINLNSIKDSEQKTKVINLIKSTRRNIVEISDVEMNQFAGNMLFLTNTQGQSFWACSLKAYNSLTAKNKQLLELEAPFIYSDLNTIETYGGGGARCMLAEVFLTLNN